MSDGPVAPPAVSVLVPTYKAGPYLMELCASLVAQTRADFQKSGSSKRSSWKLLRPMNLPPPSSERSVIDITINWPKGITTNTATNTRAGAT